MKSEFLDPIKKCWLDKRGIIETAIGQLKSIFYIQHTRHRSIPNFFANVLAGLLAYVFKPRKPRVSFSQTITHKFLLTSSCILKLSIMMRSVIVGEMVESDVELVVKNRTSDVIDHLYKIVVPNRCREDYASYLQVRKQS